MLNIAPLVVCLLVGLVASMANGANILKLGVIAQMQPAPYNLYTIAAQWINKTNLLTPYGVEIQLVCENMLYDESTAIITALDFAREEKVLGVVAATYSYLSADIQIIMARFMIPQISDSSTSPKLSNKNSYPYFMRVVSADNLQANALVNLVAKYNWKNVLLVYTADDYGIGGRDIFTTAAKAQGITVYPIALTMGETDFTQQVLTAKSTNIHVTILFSQETEGMAYLNNTIQQGMQGPNYVYIAADAIGDSDSIKNPANSYLYDGMLGIKPHQGIGALYEEVLQYINTEWPDEINGLSRADYLLLNAFHSFDSVYLFAIACKQLLDAGVPFSQINGKLYLDTLLNISILGTTGHIEFDKNGDRMGYYDIINHTNRTNKIVKLYDPSTSNFTDYAPVRFFNGSTTIPIDLAVDCGCLKGKCVNGTCVCQNGWSGPVCDVYNGKVNSKWVIAVVVPLSVVLVIVGVAAYCIYQRKRRKLVADIEHKQRSNIKHEELSVQHLIGRGAMGDVFKGTFRGSEVAIKRMIATSMNQANMESYMLEAAMMCGLRHPNIVLFMGACHNKQTKEMFLVMEYLGRGSLYDIINNKAVSISQQMQVHIATQAAQGMNFLHKTNPPIIHRDLKSHNILLDEKWNTKISDFGMTQTKQNAKTNIDDQQVGTLYWTAPEVLKGGEYTEKSDCYAFGIILWELFHREIPYGTRDPMYVALEVMNNELRPTIYESTPPDIAEIIRLCWAQNPDSRPTFAEVLEKLKAICNTIPVQVESSRIEPPKSTVYMVMTDVENSATLWNDVPSHMLQAIEVHNSILRELMKKHSGYEVSYKNNGFMVAFQEVENAANWCLDSQTKLLHATWPRGLLTHSSANEENTVDGKLLRAGLRVRMALHVGIPETAVSMQDSRTSYFGPDVDRLKKILELCQNGEIVMSSEAAGRVETVKKSLATMPYVVPYINFSDSSLYQMTPVLLKERTEDIATPAEPSLNFAESNTVQFIIPIKDIEMGTKLGRGSSGESYVATWPSKYPNSPSQEIAVKVFTSPYFTEDVMIKLTSCVSLMSKMNHPNVLKIYGGCFDVGRISLVTDYAPRGNLRALLSSTIPMDGQLKLNILREVSNGMMYIHKQDPAISCFRELKSSKVLITQDWTVKVTGFGLEIVKESIRTMTSVGAAPWTAPEIWTNSPIFTPESLTVYAFGIIMWEVFTRGIPFEKQHPIRLCEAIIRGNRPSIPPNCPLKYAELMKKCWDTSPTERPTFEYIIQQLETIILP